jgi:two-component system, OmpR family, sensor histidine kinase PrrB
VVRSLRGRLTLGVGVVIAVVLGVAGLLTSRYAERIARDALDDRLRRTAELSSATAVDAVANSIPESDRRLDAVLDATNSSLRLVVGEATILRAGAALLNGPTPPLGLRTVTEDGEPLRVLVVPLRGAGLGNLARLEVATSLRSLERNQDALDTRLLQLGLVALLAAALGTFGAAVRVLGPLRRLRRAAERVTEEEDLTVRVSESDGPAEVRGLAASVNAMLAQIETVSDARERALAATRRFALDAGHELRTPLTTVQATLSALHRHAEIPPEQRSEMLADALDEQRRLVTLLDGLQAYARGEASAAAHEDVDLAEIVAAVAAGHGVEVSVPETAVIVKGWEPGLRLMVENLVANALRHGGGDVRVELRAGPPPVLTVDDGGDGIPVADRARIFNPFERLDAAAGRDGSGLGLALVAQQAREHSASVEVLDAPSGGARFAVTF